MRVQQSVRMETRMRVSVPMTVGRAGLAWGKRGACTLCLSLVSRDQEELAARAPNLTLPSALSGPGLGFGREGEGKGYYFASVNGKSPIEP